MRVFRSVTGLIAAGLVSSAALAEEPGTGRLLGTVTSETGAPPPTLLVSASGPAGTMVATSDAAGRFEFSDLPAGLYLLRAHASGFTTAGRHVVEVHPGVATPHALRLRVLPAGTEAPAVLAASAAPGLGAVSGLAWRGTDAPAGRPLTAAPDPPERVDGSPAAPHEHSGKAWRLRRARRSVLKDASRRVQPAGAGEQPRPDGERGAGPGLPASELPGGFALSGQFQLLARTQIDSPSGAWSSGRLPGQVAYVDVGAPADEHGWGVRGAMTMGGRGSWVLAGSYLTELTPEHAIALGAFYSRQRTPHDDLDAAPVERTGAAERHAPRGVGSVRADGRWTLSRRVSVGYGAVFAHYGYLEQGRLFSPRTEVVVEPVARNPRAGCRGPQHVGARGRTVPAVRGGLLAAAGADLRSLVGLRAAAGATDAARGAGDRARPGRSVRRRRAALSAAGRQPDDHAVRSGAGGRPLLPGERARPRRGRVGAELQPRAGRTRAGRCGVQRHAVALGALGGRPAAGAGERHAQRRGTVSRRDDVGRNGDSRNGHEHLRPSPPSTRRSRAPRPTRSRPGRAPASHFG